MTTTSGDPWNAGRSSRRRRDPQIVDRRGRQIPRPCAAARSGEPAQPVRRRRIRRFRPQLRRSVHFARRRRARLFHRRRDARRRRAAAARRCAFRARPRRRSAWRSRGKVTASARRCCAAPCSPRATAASGSCTWRALPRTGACSSSRASSTPNCPSISAASSAKWNPRAPTPLSLMREFMADGHGFATAMLDLQSRMLRA